MPVMDEIHLQTNRPPPVEILRHRAAIRRTEPSLPLKCLVRDNLLTGSATFFDYGCGYGDDLEQVRQLGFRANGWDPAYRPDEAISEADIVNLGYVINVIEDQNERESTLRAAWRLAKKVISVAARISVDGTGSGEFEFGDGVITQIQTFQKYYSQTELRLYLEATLGAEAIPAAPGVFYLFKDHSLRESFAVSKYRRRTFAPRRRASDLEFERHRELLEELIRVSAALARLPFDDEFTRTDEVISKFGSLKRAFKLIRKVTGAHPWDSLRQTRIDDLRVYLALARFPKRPPFSQLPRGIQRDIKEFFGGYKSACESADILLFESGRAELIDTACQRSKIGRLTSNALYLHRSAISSLEPILRVFESCANAYLGDVEDANIVKLHRFSGKISYLACPMFETHPHPPVRRTIKLSLRNLLLQCIDHTQNKNPLLLDRKERMIETDHPWQPRFVRFSLLEAQHGLLDDSLDMLNALQWDAKLQEAGLMIKGNRLLYQAGVKRKRLPPKHLFLVPQDDYQDQTVPEPSMEDAFDTGLHDAPAVDAIDLDFEDFTSASDGRSVELPTRSRRYGIGKEIGYAVYVHRDYEDRLGATVEWAKRHLPEHYEYSVVKLNQRNDSVSFIQCPGFDVEHEPAITAILVVNATGQVQRRTTPVDPYIYHHKWLFVLDDYSGFNVAESKTRSERWIALGDVDRSRIGRKSFWEENVVHRLLELPVTKSHDIEHIPSVETQHQDESWYRSADICRILKISTCELAHLRESGGIEFKKIGRSYQYRVIEANKPSP